MAGPSGKSVALGLGVAYPVVAHFAIVSGRPLAVAASVGLLIVLILCESLRAGRVWAWLLLAAGAAGLYQLAGSPLSTLPLFAPPVLIAGGVAWLFGRSLRPGEIPLIERMARAMEGTDLDAAQRVYARQVTVAWTWLTGTLACVNLGLALLAEPNGLLATAGLHAPVTVSLATWSLFANVLNYLVLGAMFALEYAYRRHRFPLQQHRGFGDFVVRLARLGPLWARDRNEP